MKKKWRRRNLKPVFSLSSTPTGVETPDVIDLRKQQRKEPERPLYQVLEEKEEKLAPGTLLGTTHTYVVGTGTQEKSGAKRVRMKSFALLFFRVRGLCTVSGVKFKEDKMCQLELPGSASGI
ncbi:uncharacterized protein [Cicer arietinum]|uniref:uncharacterized protein n=1 Tax=Cicer arietinum TaxID=3827 RepID=UPI003CC58E00